MNFIMVCMMVGPTPVLTKLDKLCPSTKYAEENVNVLCSEESGYALDDEKFFLPITRGSEYDCEDGGKVSRQAIDALDEDGE